MNKYFNYAIAAIVLTGLSTAGCASSEEEITPSGNTNKSELKIQTRADAAEAAYPHKIFLVADGLIENSASGANAAALTPFSVEPGTYSVYATAASDEANLTFSGIDKSGSITSSRIKIKDMTAQIPEILVGNSDPVTVGEVDATANIELKRVIASVNVTLNGLETLDATSITLTINNMYDQVSLDGAPSKSGAAFVSKSLTLTKNASGKFVGNAIVLPTDANATALSLVYDINGTKYESAPKGKIEANNHYSLTTNVDGATASTYKLTSVATYAQWNSELVSLSDSFNTTAEKAWVGPTALPYSSGGTYNNFWATSDGGDPGYGESYWATNLYDGNKADGSNYWAPASWDVAAPKWYIDLGAAKQGLTITYWNKAGGKGGQKIRTFDIFGSNAKDDYNKKTSTWTKIMTFTSDKTTPTTDAGAEVTTGQIKFAEDGSLSYQYILCTFTSKVSNTGEVVTDNLDVNVGELELATWEYK